MACLHGDTQVGDLLGRYRRQRHLRRWHATQPTIKLELGDQGGEGDYTFTVLVDPPPAFTEFIFDDLPSGSNLFGIVGDADAGLIVFGKNIGLKADNTYIANQTQE